MSAAPERRPLRTIETPVGPFDLLEGGIVFWTVSFGSVIDERMARKAYEATLDLAEGGRVAIVVDARGLGFADRGARDLLADTEIEGRVSTAVVVAGRIVRWLANQYARQVEGRRLIRIFNAEGEAIAWSLEQLRKAREA